MSGCNPKLLAGLHPNVAALSRFFGLPHNVVDLEETARKLTTHVLELRKHQMNNKYEAQIPYSSGVQPACEPAQNHTHP